MPQQPKNRAPQHQSCDAAATATATTAVQHDTTEWGGRSRCPNTENEGPDAAAVTPIPGGAGASGGGCGSRTFSHQLSERTPPHSHSSSSLSPSAAAAAASWRQLKKLDHHPRQISPSLVAALPAVVVESGPPPAADGGGGEGGGGRHPHKRMRKVQTEDDSDVGISVNNVGAGRGSYYAYNGSPLMVPGSGASSRCTSLSPSPPLPRLGLYLGSPLVDSASSSAAAAAATVSTAGPTAANKCSFSSDSDHNQHHAASPEWEREQPLAAGAGGGGGDDDAAAAAVRVLGLRNGHMSAAAAAVAATQPPAAVVVGSKRPRTAVEQARASMPTATKAVHGPSATTQGSGGGEVGGRRSSTGTRQRTDKR